MSLNLINRIFVNHKLNSEWQKTWQFKNLIFQNGTSSWGGTRKMPYTYIEQGTLEILKIEN